MLPNSINVIHQNHDYSHLPGGKPPYRLEETERNRKLAGGKPHMYLILDTNVQLINGELCKPKGSMARRLTPIGVSSLSQARRFEWDAPIFDQPAGSVATDDRSNRKLNLAPGFRIQGNSSGKWLHPQPVTVFIVTYIPFLAGYYAHSLDVLKVCLGSILAHTSGSFDLVVFDNASLLEVVNYLNGLKAPGRSNI